MGAGDIAAVLEARTAIEVEDLIQIGLVAVIEAAGSFEDRGLVRWQGSRLSLSDDALPYARAIAATL